MTKLLFTKSRFRSLALYGVILLSTLMPTHSGVLAETTVNDSKPTILVWGDSLSAAYGIPLEKGWVSLLQDKLKDSHKVVNGSISGETTIGGLTRLPAALEAHQPDFLLLELGANDGLRGLPTKKMQENLQKMIELAQATEAKTVLLGIKIPPNYGMLYTNRFDKVYTDLAEKFQLPLLPFLLDEVALDYDLMQADGLHPTADAQPQVLNNVWSVLESALLPAEAQDEQADKIHATPENKAADEKAQ